MKNGNGTIWRNIEKLMTAHKLDIAKLSELSGISRQSLYNLKNKGSANTETIKKIADAFGVGPGYLME